MPRDLPPLSALRAFEAAARTLSFKRAAEELRVTPAAVSQQIKSLEDHAGIPLFRRLPRALALTEAGARAAPEVTAGFEILERAYATMRTGGLAGPLTVSLPPSLASKWLVPRLGRFQASHPDIDVRIDAASRLVRFDQEEIDLAIRFGLGRYPGLRSERLFRSRTVPVCAPDLVTGPDGIRSIDDLARVPLLHMQETGAAAMEDTWALWLKAACARDVDPTRGPRFNTHGLLVDAAVAGQGVALVEFVFAEEEIKSGKLVQPFAALPMFMERFGYHIVYPPHALEDARVAAFRDWVLRERDDSVAADTTF
jgi:LysR family glycine cleavage system transcriptional activator